MEDNEWTYYRMGGSNNKCRQSDSAHMRFCMECGKRMAWEHDKTLTPRFEPETGRKVYAERLVCPGTDDFSVMGMLKLAKRRCYETVFVRVRLV